MCVCVLDDDKCVRSLDRHFLALRRSSTYQSALFVVFIEANLSWTICDRIAKRLLRSKNGPFHIVSMDSTGAGRPGVWTSDISKEDAAMSTRRCLRDGSIRFADEFICPGVTPDSAKRADHKNNSKSFRFRTKAPADYLFGKFRTVMSGKAPGMKDDVAMCAQQLILDISVLSDRSDFTQYLQRQWGTSV